MVLGWASPQACQAVVSPLDTKYVSHSKPPTPLDDTDSNARKKAFSSRRAAITGGCVLALVPFLGACTEAPKTAVKRETEYCSIGDGGERINLDLKKGVFFTEDLIMPLNIVATDEAIGTVKPYPLAIPVESHGGPGLSNSFSLGDRVFNYSQVEGGQLLFIWTADSAAADELEASLLYSRRLGLLAFDTWRRGEGGAGGYILCNGDQGGTKFPTDNGS